MRAPLLALLLAVPAVAQTAFEDDDFGFSIQMPPGLQVVDEAGRAKILGSAEKAKNIPRATAAGQPVTHNYYWLDATSPYNRQAAVFLLDSPPPWDPSKPDEFVTAMTGQGLKVDFHEFIKPPVFGLRIEGTFTRPNDGKLMRKTLLYLPDLFGKRYGIVSFQAFDADWNIVKPEFLAALGTVQMQRADPPAEVVEAAKARAEEQAAAQGGPGGPGEPGVPGGPPGPVGPAGRGAQPAAKQAPAAPPADWGSLRVAGSFVLAALLLGHLLLSGRAR
jgi:hypothetical protein